MAKVDKNNELLKQHIANQLKSARIKAGLTQYTFATLLGVDRTTIAKYENGKAIPSLISLPAICKTLHISADELLNIS